MSHTSVSETRLTPPLTPGVTAPVREIVTPAMLPHRASVPMTATDLLHCAVRGFEIASFPALEDEFKDLRKELVKTILYRFQAYITELHGGSALRAVALQLMSHPDQATFGARVRAYLLCRSAAKEADAASADAARFAEQVRQSFPSDGLFCYGSPRALDRPELERVLFHGVDNAGVRIAEIRKYEESQTWSDQPPLHYVPHRLWSDQLHDPWLSLIETLAAVPVATAIRVELTPVQLTGPGLDFITLAGRWFDVIQEDLKRKADQGDQVRTDGIVTEDMLRQEEVARASANAAHIAYVRRGAHVYERLNTFAHSAFCMRIVLASAGAIPASVIGSVRAALSMPSPDEPQGSAGWHRPDVVEPGDGDRTMALSNLRYLAQTRWGRSAPNAAAAFDIDLRPVVTPEEAVALFHLPIYDRAGLTSAVSTVESPFVIPPEAFSATRDDDPDKRADFAKATDDEKADPERWKKRRIVVGHLFQRERLLDPVNDPEHAQPFHVTVGDLMKPSLLVGAPGSGKTNLALGLLIELWEKHRVPFLILDPSTGQEFRLLLQHAAFKNSLIVYTVGDPDGFPLEFNPFSVPPDVSVRSHTTRLLAAFRAAIEMQDPIPAIFEGALERVYTGLLSMNARGRLDSPAPSFADFNRAMRDELKERVLPLYAGSQQTIGNLRGASTMRVNSILKKLGYIINVEGNNGDFLQEMLQRPTVIEMGALGDSSNIALVMAFFLSQLAGHIEYAYRRNPSRKHVIMIEEAHRLLGGHEGEGAANKSAEDLNMMLAEVRKFGQGILVMDQRPSSLVGGVLDNAYVRILMRLSDQKGFERLSNELNLSGAHQRYARTRLRPGDAILLDREAGQPVLVHGVDLKDALDGDKPTDAEQMERIRANATGPDGLKAKRPSAVPFVELPLEPDTPAPAAPTAAVAVAAATQTSIVSPPAAPVAKAYYHPAIERFGTAVGASLQTARDQEAGQRMWWGVKGTLFNNPNDLGGARAIVERELKSVLPIEKLTDQLWKDTVQAVLDSLVASEVKGENTLNQVREYAGRLARAGTNGS